MAGIVSPVDRYVVPEKNYIECFRQEFEYRDADIPWFLQRAAVRLGVDVRSLSWSIQKSVHTGDLSRGLFYVRCESNQLMLPLIVSLHGGLPTDESGYWDGSVPEGDFFEIRLEDSSLELPFAYNRVTGFVGDYHDMIMVPATSPGSVTEKTEYSKSSRTNALGYVAIHVVHSGGLARVLADYASFGYEFDGDYMHSVYFEYMLITANQ